jgi:CheY-like chemotaxis protein
MVTGLDGFELCRQLRTSDPHTPIVFFSAAAYDTDKRRAIQAGANEYVAKPDIIGLLEMISRHIPDVEVVPV